MTYKICKIKGVPQFDSLPIAKITTYPLEQRDYKPYAQCILCVGEDALSLRMWAFEVSPLPDSSLRAVLYLFRDKPDTALCVDLFSDGVVRACLLSEGEVLEGTEMDAVLRPFGGEDLQGVYWGATVQLKLDALQAAGGALLLEPGDQPQGNFFKLCDQKPFVHYGCCFPADFSRNPYTIENMGAFMVVGY